MQCQKLKLTLSPEKTFITHAVSDKARFLGYEVTVSRENSLVAKTTGARATNGCIALLMPRDVVSTIRGRFSVGGKVVHRTEIIDDTDYTIVQRFQSVLRGIYNYYCLATNVGDTRRMGRVKWILHASLTKTLAHKHKCSVTKVCRKYRAVEDGYKVLRVVVNRPGKKPLVATFGGIPFVRDSKGLRSVDFQFFPAWKPPATERSEVVVRMLAERCVLCGAEGPVQMHHIRKLADIDRPGRRPRARWERIMSARKRKTLAVCEDCHQGIHAGKYEGSSFRNLLESRVP